MAVILVSTGHNLRHQGQYVITDRDSGIYVVAGKWIAEHGTLWVDSGVGDDVLAVVSAVAQGRDVGGCDGGAPIARCDRATWARIFVTSGRSPRSRASGVAEPLSRSPHSRKSLDRSPCCVGSC